MNDKNRCLLWKKIQEAGLYLQNKLPDSINHPKGRNPYAHISLCIKNKFGVSYKDLSDVDFKKVVDYIDFLKKNPSL